MSDSLIDASWALCFAATPDRGLLTVEAMKAARATAKRLRAGSVKHFSEVADRIESKVPSSPIGSHSGAIKVQVFLESFPEIIAKCRKQPNDVRKQRTT